MSKNKILIVEVGDGYTSGDGGIELINAETLQSSGYIVTESDFNGNMVERSIIPKLTSTGKGYIVVDSDWNEYGAFSKLFEFTLEGDITLIKQIVEFENFVSPVLDGDGILYVGVRSLSDPGIVVYDSASKSWIQETPVSTGLPPMSLSLF